MNQRSWDSRVRGLLGPTKLPAPQLGLVFLILLWWSDVPLYSAILLAILLVSQSLLGYSLIRILPSRPAPSLPVIAGPSLIVGGFVMVGVFHVAGRAGSGTAAVIAVLVFSALTSLRRFSIHGNVQPPSHLLLHTVGVSLLLLSWDHIEYLPACSSTVALIAIGRFDLLKRRGARYITFLTLALWAASPILFRSRYWWAETSDIQFFEVLSRHITTSGPFADWGIANWSRYHWFIYSWSGLFEHLSLSDLPYSTLTRVTPIVFSIALAGCLTSFMKLGDEKLRENSSITRILMCWAIAALVPQDWSGPSTAAGYAILAACCWILDDLIKNRRQPIHLILLTFVLLAITVLTKVTYVFALIPIVTTSLWFQLNRRPRLRYWPQAIGLAATALSVTALGVWALKATEGLFIISIPRSDPQENWVLAITSRLLGEVASNPAVLLLACIALIMLNRERRDTTSSVTDAGAVGLTQVRLSTLLISGLAFGVFVSGPGSTQDYFDEPAYFVALIVILSALQNSALPLSPKVSAQQSMGVLRAAAFVASFGILWNVLIGRADGIWSLPSRTQTRFWGDVHVGVAIAIALGLTARLALTRWTNRGRNLDFSQALLAVMFSTVISIFAVRIAELRTIREMPDNRAEAAALIGSSEEEDVGRWLRKNTSKSSVIATNSFLQGESFSLAVYSDREYFILGPDYVRSTPAKAEAMSLSKAVADNPSVRTFRELQDRNISYFVVDRAATSSTTWSKFANIVYENSRFVVLEIDVE